MAFKLTWLAEVLEDAGLKVAEQTGWRTRGHGDMGTVSGVMCHHTAGPLSGNMPSLGVITNGRPGLAGPLSQLGLGRDGTYYVVAAGRCSHAGGGNWQGITTGNSSFIGIEAENTGLNERSLAGRADGRLPTRRRGDPDRESGRTRACAAGTRSTACRSGRKSDPSFDMHAFRQPRRRHHGRHGAAAAPDARGGCEQSTDPAARGQGRSGQGGPKASRCR